MADVPTVDERPAPKKRATAKVMKRARTVQLSMLPKMPAIEGLDLYAHYAPCEAVGGDFYDIVPVSPWEIGIVMGDVAGHGVDAALTMAMAKKTLQIHGKGRSSPRETLLVTCADLAADLPGNSFVTVFYGVLDLRSWQLTFASAGHTPPILFNPDRTPPLQSVPARGVVMGGAFVQAMEKNLAEQTIHLRRGDTLFLYTDGLSEAPNAEDEQFGEPRILEALGALQGGDAREIVSSVITDLDRFVAGHPQQDDLTLLAMRIAGEPQAAARVPQNQRRRVWPTNLPPATSTFIGRANELAQLQQWLHDEGALVTIQGATGMGKSRLAAEAGRALLNHLPGGVWLVDAGTSADAEQLALAVSRVLGVAPSSSGPIVEAVGATLDFRPPLLLILDNCEGAERMVCSLLENWRGCAPRVRFLVTGRGSLGMPGERVLELKPLAMPTSPDENEVLDESDATSLFVARARESNPLFRVTDSSRNRIASIVRELGGNPLAIELAAAQSAELSPRQIDDGLRDERETRPPASKGGRRPSEPDVARWAYDQLQPDEKLAFCQLSLMRGGFYLEAAEGVVELPADSRAGDITVVVQTLLDRQLLQAENTPYGMRFHVPPPLKPFGRRMRAESFSPEREDALARRFVTFYANYAAAQEARFHTRHAREVLDRLETDIDNILAAQDLANAMDLPALGARALIGLVPMYELRSPMLPRLDRLNRALACLGEKGTEMRARLHMELANFAFHENKWEDALAQLAAAAKLCREARNDRLLCDALLFRTFILARHNDHKEARRLVEQATTIAARAEYALCYERALIINGIVTSQDSGAAEALQLYERAEPLIRAREDLPTLLECLNCKGSALRALGRLPEALACSQETVKLLTDLNAPLAIAVQDNNIGQVHLAMGYLDDALECYLRSEAALRDIGDRMALPRVLCNIAELYQFFDQAEDAEAYAREALALAEKDNDKRIQLRVQHIFGHLALGRRQHEQALAGFEAALALAREIGRPADISIALAFVSLCRTETGDARQGLADIMALQQQGDTVSEQKNALAFLLSACRAKAEHRLGHRKQAVTALKEAQGLAKLERLDHYSSDMLLHAAWAVVDELAAEGLGDLKAEQTIKVRCTHCRAKVRGTQKQVDDLVACPVCKTAPFHYRVEIPRHK
jgi:predicted ATPase